MRTSCVNQLEALAMVVTCHEYGVSVLVPQTSLRQETSGGVAKCQLFSKVTFKLFQFVC